VTLETLFLEDRSLIYHGFMDQISIKTSSPKNQLVLFFFFRLCR
jgi:hypothetical protein